jgi:four helix bundle protein
MEKHRTSNIERRTSNEAGPRATPLDRNAAGKRVFDLEERLLKFACVIIEISEKLPNTRSGDHVAGQLLRSGTSPYSNHGEAESAESSDDFIHKLKICLKELRETRRWLRLIHRKEWLTNDPQLKWTLVEVEEMIRIFVASIRTAKENQLRGKLGETPSETRS